MISLSVAVVSSSFGFGFPVAFHRIEHIRILVADIEHLNHHIRRFTYVRSSIFTPSRRVQTHLGVPEAVTVVLISRSFVITFDNHSHRGVCFVDIHLLLIALRPRYEGHLFKFVLYL